MSLDIHVFSNQQQLFSFIQQQQTPTENPFQSLSVVVPTVSLQHTLLDHFSSVDIQVFSLQEYVRNIILDEGEFPFFESPVLSFLIHEVTEKLAHHRSHFVHILETSLQNFDRGQDGLIDSVRALITAGVNTQQCEAMMDLLEEKQRSSSNKNEVWRAQAVVAITNVILALLHGGHGILQKKNDDLFNIGMKEAAIVQAAQLIEKGANPPSSHILFHGFSDFTGLQLQFLESLAQSSSIVRCDILMMAVFDPAIPHIKTLDASYRLIKEKLESKLLSYSTQHEYPKDVQFAKLKFTSAVGYRAELRHVLSSVRAKMEAGISIHDMLLIAPSWEAYKPYLREEMTRLNIPFEMTKPYVFSTQKTQKMENFIQLVIREEAFSLSSLMTLFSFDVLNKDYLDCCADIQKNEDDRILDASIMESQSLILEDIQLFFQAFGLVDLEELDAQQNLLMDILEKGKKEISIPALLQMKAIQKKDALVYHASRRKLPVEFLRQVSLRCLHLLTILRALPTTLETKQYGKRIADILVLLGWSKLSEEFLAIHSALSRVKRIHESYPSIVWTDFLSLFSKELHNFGVDIVGQIRSDGEQKLLLLNLSDSSGFFAQHMFFLGVNKGAFPTTYQTDPLFTEEIRTLCKEINPSIRGRSDSYLEERHRFYLLLSCCSVAHLSWVKTDDMGQASSISPIVRRLLLMYTDDAIDQALSLQERVSIDYPQTYWDRILLSGVHGDHDTHKNAFSLHAKRCWKELYFELDDEQKEKKIRRAVLGRMQNIAELYPRLLSNHHKRIGPYGGLTGLGPQSGAISQEPFVSIEEIPDHLQLDHNSFITRVEQYVACPWRNFLSRLLRLEYTQNPQKTLPVLNANTLGNIAHNTLEGLVLEQTPEDQAQQKDIEDLLPPCGFTVSWDDKIVDYQSKEQSLLQMRSDQQLWPKAEEIAYDIVQPYLALERQLEFQTPRFCLGAELEGEGHVVANVDGGKIGGPDTEKFSLWGSSEDSISIRVLFKADRVDVDKENGILTLIDYKTGKILAKKNSSEARKKELIKEMRKGKKLQPAAYVSALHTYQSHWPELTAANGSLLYLKPDDQIQDISMRVFSLSSADDEAIDVLSSVLWKSAVGQTLGINIPRLVTKKGRSGYKSNEWCKHCDFQRACRFGDSGFRQRLITACHTTAIEKIEQQDIHVHKQQRIRDWSDFLISHIWNIGE